ncbi:MAG: hypothetical protein KDK06_04005 [Gammaproteobacteria bacterium]|nr:hypothetical protein [Gammaproteobacteria bacterium]
MNRSPQHSRIALAAGLLAATATTNIACAAPEAGLPASPHQADTVEPATTPKQPHLDTAGHAPASEHQADALREIADDAASSTTDEDG